MTTNWQDGVAFYRDIPGMDPQVEWSLGPGRPYYFLPGRQTHWIPILLRLDGISPGDFAAGHGLNVSNWQAMVRIPDYFKSRSEPDCYCAALVTEAFFLEMRTNSVLRDRVPEIRLGLPLDKESLPPPPP